MSHPGYPFLVNVWGRPSLMVGPVLGILPSKRLSCGRLQLAVSVYRNLRALAAKANSGLRPAGRCYRRETLGGSETKCQTGKV